MDRGARGYVIVLLAAVCFGTLGIFSKLYYDEGGEPFALLLLRFAGMGPTLLVLAVVRRHPPPPLRLALLVSALGVLQLGAGFSLIEGFARAPVGLVVLLFYVYPLIVTLAAARLFREELGVARALVLALGTAGVALTVGFPGTATALGIVLGLAAGFFVAALVLFARHLTVSHALSPLWLTALMFLSPAPALGVIAAVRGVELGVGAAGWSAALGAIFISGVAGTSLFYTGVALVGASTASLLAIAEPFAAVALAYVVLGESLAALQLVGGALILGAVAVLSLQAFRSSRRRSDAVPPTGGAVT